jgi:MYXO-CTERM domain-containing protein
VRAAAFAAVIATPDSFACHFAPVGVDGDPGVMANLGLAPGIRPQDRRLADYARLFFASPVYSHFFWGALALVLLVWRRRRAIAMTGLLAGALLFTLTFVIVSIACDYRYLVFLDLAAMTAALGISRDPA